MTTPERIAQLTKEFEAKHGTEPTQSFSNGKTNHLHAKHLGLWEGWLSAHTDSQMAKDAERLDFVLRKGAWVVEQKADSGAMTYQLWCGDEDENIFTISGEGKYFSSYRHAIDAAITKEQTK